MENRTVDLIIDSNVDFAYTLFFEDSTILNGVEHSTPMDISNLVLKGSISKDLGSKEKIVDLFFREVKPESGLVNMELDIESVNRVQNAASDVRDKYSPRLRFVGYYDVLAANASKGFLRILEGKVYISDGVTK